MQVDLTKTRKFMLDLFTLGPAMGVIMSGIIWIITSYYSDEIDAYHRAVDFTHKGRVMIDSLGNELDKLKEENRALRRELSAGQSTHAVGLRVDEKGDLWYRDTDLKMYRAYYREEYGAYYFTDNFGDMYECH